MRDCEHYETLLSTWLDDQLDRAGQIECLDHVVRCPACRDFYLDARALDGLIAAMRPDGAAEAPPPEVWKRIERATRGERRRPARRRVPAWALQAAAVLVVALGVTLATWNDSFAPRPPADEVVLGQGGDMTEARFVELTKEVLGADPRYRAAMQRVLEQVARDTARAVEASSEEAAPWPEGRERVEPVEVDARRIPA
jgi:predicted anti-sigma-YlaC factor YlaD